MDLPYKAEYAKSNRASCRFCKSRIEKDTLRLALMVKSPNFDGKIPKWYHQMCFFRYDLKKQWPKTIDDIDHFESLRWEDQEQIKSKIQTAQKGTKRNVAVAGTSKPVLEDFLIEYSRSSRAMCHGCQKKIVKDEIRISKKDLRKQVLWHHATCFVKFRLEMGYSESADKLPGFDLLTQDDQEEIKKQIFATKQEEIPEKKPKVEDETDGSSDETLEKKLEAQNKLLFSYRDELKELNKKELSLILEINEQDLPSGVENMLDRISDIMAFGALEPCTVCQGGQLVFDKLGYKCHGNLTEWSRCDVITKEPKRCSFIVPTELKEKYTFLKKYKYVKGARLIREKKEEQSKKTNVEQEYPPLYNMEFVIIGNVDGRKDKIKKQIMSFGGKVTTKIKKTLMAVISTTADVEKMGARIVEAKNADIPVVPSEFLNEVKEYSGHIPELVLKTSVCSWGNDPHTRLPPEPSSSSGGSMSKSGSRQNKSYLPSTVRLKLKTGGAVDPDSGLQNTAHIYQSGKDKYTAVLGLTDIQKQKNSYYNLQILESDYSNRYWMFRSWGRIGTTVGGNILQEMSLKDAKEEFCQLYKEKSGNMWKDRDNFVKLPGLMYPIDVDYGEEEAELKLHAVSDVPSKLTKPVQELIELIFDINEMNKVMLEFELDAEKMPLGKLSKSQLQSAYGVLTELHRLVETGGTQSSFIDASNRFYTFVPHSFGTSNPPVINDLETIKKKIEMIDNLMELEIAYNLMIKSIGSNNTIDARYDQLKTELDTLAPTSEEYQIIQEYMKNTHAATHSNCELDLLEVFTVKRKGEEKRFKPFKKLHNRRLLWHGSHTTNFAGILSQGLRIAPPEAPASGYMFGKGIYFADMVSKSANYCRTSSSNNIGLLLLCEVALGEMHELEHAKYVDKLPEGKQSVKGIGRTEPDPQHTKELPGGIHVPLGKGIIMDRPEATSLLYNEYIIYDVAQVNIKYLLKINFNYGKIERKNYCRLPQWL